jgi:hypothetical protein
MSLKYIYTSRGFVEVDSKYFERNFNDLTNEYKMTVGSIPANGGTIRLLLKQPKEFSTKYRGSNIYNIGFSSTYPVVINMMRISQ